MILKKREVFIIPSYISIFYLKKKKFVIFKCEDRLRLFKLNMKLHFILLKNKFFIIVNYLNTSINKNTNKMIKIQQNIYYNKIKLFILETTSKLYKKLNLVGVGYKVFKTKNFVNNDILLFKLGFSHFIYIKVNKNKVNLFCLKNIRLFITGDFLKINQVSALIKSLKKPESYKGKGIRFQNEHIVLKQIKKK